MIRYLMSFVLVMLMVKTNAQTTVLYKYKGAVHELNESDDRLLIRPADENDPAQHRALREKISKDANFTMLLGGGRYYILEKKKNAVISKKEAIAYYINEPYIGYVSFQFTDGKGYYSGVTQELLAQPKAGVTLQQVEGVGKQYGLTAIRQFEATDGIYHLYFSRYTNVLDIVEKLYQAGLFEYVEPNVFLNMPSLSSVTNSSYCSSNFTSTYVSDPLAPSQWGLYNNGTAYGGTANCDINICNAWQMTSTWYGATYSSGNGIKVAVIDDGVLTSHSDLNILRDGSGNVIGQDCIPPGFDSNPMACTEPGCANIYSTHGTKCASVVASKANSDRIVGVAYDSKIMPIRAWFTDLSVGQVSDATFLTSAFNFARTNGADVISLSFRYYPGGFFLSSSTLQTAINNAATLGRGGKGCVIAVATGNDNLSNIGWPASNPNVIAVGGVSMCFERKSPTSCDGQNWGANYGTGLAISGDPSINTSGFISVVAPCVDVLLNFFDNNTPINEIVDEDAGTSFATPHVAGTAALMLSVNPCLTAAEVKEMIELTASKVGSYSYTTSKPNGMWNNEMGYGLLNAGDAVQWAQDIYRQNEVTNFTKTYMTPNRIFSGFATTVQKPFGNYTVAAGSKITFKAGTFIELIEGFSTTFSAASDYFIAEIDGTCSNAHSHYKEVGELVNKVYGNDNSTSSSSPVKLYPNPAKTAVNLEFTLATDEHATFIITNIVGQKVSEAYSINGTGAIQTQILPVADLVPGVYLVEMQTSKGSQNLRFIKE